MQISLDSHTCFWIQSVVYIFLVDVQGGNLASHRCEVGNRKTAWTPWKCLGNPYDLYTHMQAHTYIPTCVCVDRSISKYLPACTFSQKVKWKMCSTKIRRWNPETEDSHRVKAKESPLGNGRVPRRTTWQSQQHVQIGRGWKSLGNITQEDEISIWCV